MLNASEILSQGYKSSSLPDEGGQKDFKPDGSQAQNENLKRTLEECNTVLHEERITRKLNLSVAHWDPELKKAIVDVKRRNYFHQFGTQTKDGLFMFPEEALFLVDQGCLELYFQDLPLSVQEAHMLLIAELPSFEYYQVYAYLCRIGYVALRYEKVVREVPTPESERPIAPTAVTNTTEKEDDCDSNPFALEPMISGPMANLWEGKVGERPLMRPSDARNTAAVLSKLQIIKPLKFVNAAKSIMPPLTTSNQDDAPLLPRYEIAFDVYASKQVRKKDRSSNLPDYRIVVCRYSDPPPSLHEMSRLSKESHPVHLKIGVVNQGSVSFYGMFGVDLPTVISLG